MATLKVALKSGVATLNWASYSDSKVEPAVDIAGN